MRGEMSLKQNKKSPVVFVYFQALMATMTWMSENLHKQVTWMTTDCKFP